MIELSLLNDNIGGLLDVYAIPVSAVTAMTVNYATRVRSLTLSSTSGVVHIPVYADESFSFEEPHGRDDSGDYWQPSVSGVIPGTSFANADVLELLERGEWVVVHVDQNGVSRVSGDADTPLTFESTAQTGAAYTDRNGCAFTFSGRLGHPSYHIDVEFS